MTSPDRPASLFRRDGGRIFPRNPNTNWLNIASMLTDAAFETDPAGKFTAFGQSHVLGFAAADLIGRNIADLCRLRGAESWPGHNFGMVLASLAEQGRTWRGVVTLARADGGQGTYQIFLAPKAGEASGAKTLLAKTANAAPMAGAYGLLTDLDSPELAVAGPDPVRARMMLDPQTGIWSPAAFAAEAGRRFDRLDVEGLPGTLLLLGFSRTPPVGRAAVATRLVEELREIIRPTDLLGRINATTLGLWCDGMDDLTGAERASRFVLRLPASLPGNPAICVGLAARWPGSLEEIQTLLLRADIALQQAERVAEAAHNGDKEAAATGAWRAWNPQSPPAGE